MMDPNESQGVEPEVTQDNQIIQDQVSPSEESGTGNINPAWNPLLETLPSSLHSLVTPHLTKWDQNFQSKIQEVHSQYEPYKRYLESQVPPEDIDYALQVLQKIQDEPQTVVEAIQKYYLEQEEDNAEQGLEDNQDLDPEEEFEFANHPKWQRMEQMVQQMAQIMVQQRDSKLQAEADSQLESDWKAAQEKYGEFDEDWVLSKLLNNDTMTVDEAVQSYVEWQQTKEQQLLEKIRKPGPPVLPGGGSVPNTNVPVSQLGNKDRQSLVAQMLANAARAAE